jgi:hypothetical protein
MVIVSETAEGYSLIVSNVAHGRIQVDSEVDGEKRQISAGLNGDGIIQGGY